MLSFVIQVLGATLDGSSVNCWLIKVHSPQGDVVYKIAIHLPKSVVIFIILRILSTSLK